MNKRWHAPIKLVVLIGVVVALPTASRAQGQVQVRVIMSGGFSAAFQELQPEFEKTTGIKVTVRRGASQGGGPETIRDQLHARLPEDVVHMSRVGAYELLAG